MHAGKYKLRVAGVAGAAVLALAASACGGSTSPSSSGGVKVKGGTATVSVTAGSQPNSIFPFVSIDYDTVYNVSQFQWLFYRPLYYFGGNNLSVNINNQLSVAKPPVYSNGGKTVTINTKGWRWSNGETVGADSIKFFLNMMEAEKANEAGYTPGLLPDNLASYTVTGPNTIVLNLKQAYSSVWFTYNQLAIIIPMPVSWDTTSLTGAPDSGGCLNDSAADKWAKCVAVWNFLTAQNKISSTYVTSPIWSVVDGPWKLSAFSATGADTIVPNTKYSGSPRPTLAALKFVPYTDDTTEYEALKSDQINIGYIPPQDLPQKAAGSALPPTNPLAAENYNLSTFYAYAIDYYQVNFDNPTLGPAFRQLYVRQALEYLDDQAGMDKSIYRGYGYPTTGMVPNEPANSFEPPIEQGNGPYPYSPAKANSLLASHGWTKVNGVATCTKPGTAANECGAGVAKGLQLKFDLDYSSGATVFQEEAQIYKSDLAKAGIDATVNAQSFNTIIAEARPCPVGPKCTWQALMGGGWVFDGPGFEPTGESLFATGAGSNTGSYSNAEMDKLINETHTSNSLAVFKQYATYAAQQLPFLPMPNSYGIIAISSDLHNVYNNPDYAFTPEYWYFTKK